MRQQADRQVFLDVAKGIGIILVVWAHAGGPFNKWINAFHMPMFFFISGMLYKGAGKSIPEFCKRKMKSLLFPFWTWNLILYPVFFALYYWKKWDIVTGIRGVMEIVLTVNKTPFLGATWFLPALFWVSVCVHIFIILTKKYILLGEGYADVLLLLASIIVATIGINITFPYRISRTMICSLYYVSGYIFSKYIKEKMSEVLSMVVAVISVMSFVLLTLTFKSSLSSNVYDSKIAFIIGAYCGTYFVIWVSEKAVKYLQNSIIVNHIAYLGIESIHLVIWQFLAFRFVIIIQIIVMGAKLKALTAFPVYDASGMWWLVYLVSGIYGSLLIAKFIKYLKIILFGNNDRLKALF